MTTTERYDDAAVTTPCQHCGKPYKVPNGIAIHERECKENPNRVPRAAKGQGKSRRKTTRKTTSRRRTTKKPAAITQADTTDLIVGALFPNGMPTNPEFVRAFRIWLDATDKLVALASIDQ
jgi:hypothetical protein